MNAAFPYVPDKGAATAESIAALMGTTCRVAVPMLNELLDAGLAERKSINRDGSPNGLCGWRRAS